MSNSIVWLRIISQKGPHGLIEYDPQPFCIRFRERPYTKYGDRNVQMLAKLSRSSVIPIPSPVNY
jgi:hypothetical protein